MGEFQLPTQYSKSFTIWDEVLYYSVTKKDGSVNFCLVVSRCLKKDVLQQAHFRSGHLGQKKTLSRAEDFLYLGNLKYDVYTYVKNCLICEQHQRAAGLQQR